MAVSSLSAARRVCARSGWTLSNLQLQKILYLAHMVHMGRTRGDRLLKLSFQAWDYGPVQPNLYRRVKIFGNRPVEDIFFSADPIDDDTAEAKILDSACDHFSAKRPSELVAITHRDGSAWAKNYRAGTHGIVIPDADIVAEYDQYFGKPQFVVHPPQWGGDKFISWHRTAPHCLHRFHPRSKHPLALT